MIYLEEQRDYPPLFRAVGCVVWSRGRLLLLKRIEDKSHPSCWGIPTGKVESNESDMRAMIRELFEETGILVSGSNIKFAKFYHVITSEKSFFYNVYIVRFSSVPAVRIERREHTDYTWVTPQEALQLMLVSDLDACLQDLLPLLDVGPVQLSLLPLEKDYENNPLELEQSIESVAKLQVSKPHNIKQWYTVLGPPSAGKTTALKKMTQANPSLVYVADTSVFKQSTALNYFLRKAFEDKDHSYFFKFQMSILTVRYFQAVNARDGSLVDETIFSTLAYSRALYRLGWLDRYEYETFYRHYLTYNSFLANPTAVFYLNCDAETLLRRIKRRGRIIERNYSIDYIETLCFTFSETAGELSKECDVIPIDTGKLRVAEIVRRYAPSTPNQPSRP